MPVARTLDLVAAGRDGGYAVAAVNIVDDLSVRAVVAAAEDLQAPIILQTSVKTLRASGVLLLQRIVLTAAEAASVPVALHLDHCPYRDVISAALDAGWSSVLFDASDRSYEQAHQETTEVVAEAHAVGAAVECEIENITGVEDDIGSNDEAEPYPLEQLVTFAEETGSDLLAPALGTAHGLYTSAPKLQPERAQALRELTRIPLVLHGGTGLSAENFTEFIRAGVSKINISTALKIAYMKSAATHLEHATRTGKFEPVKMFDDIFAGVRDEIAIHLEIFGCAGKSSDHKERA